MQKYYHMLLLCIALLVLCVQASERYRQVIEPPICPCNLSFDCSVPINSNPTIITSLQLLYQGLLNTQELFNAGKLTVEAVAAMGYFDSLSYCTALGPFPTCKPHPVTSGALGVHGLFQCSSLLVQFSDIFRNDPNYPHENNTDAPTLFFYSPSAIDYVFPGQFVATFRGTVNYAGLGKPSGPSAPIVADVSCLFQARLNCDCNNRLEEPSVVWAQFTFLYLDKC